MMIAGRQKPIVQTPVVFSLAPCMYVLVLNVGEMGHIMTVHLPHEIAYPEQYPFGNTQEGTT